MRRLCFGILVFLVPWAVAAEDQPKSGASPADRLATIQKEQESASAAFQKAAAALPDTPDGQKQYDELSKAFDKGQADRFMAAVDLAKADPESDVGFAALEWVLTIPRADYLPVGKEAMELVKEHHATNPKVGKIVACVGRCRMWQGDADKAAVALIEAVAAKNPDKTARGQAALALAVDAESRFFQAEHRTDPETDRLAAKAEEALEAVLKDYADCPNLIRENAGTLADVAKPKLFELRHLRIGLVAPDIEGEDLDGAKFKLSDYRGKVVVLDFWGDW